MIPPCQRKPRTRNAAATREAMLVSARRHFARDSYDNVGLREIARDVGVDPALVGRYFGGKEQLFTEAVRGGDKDMMRDVTGEGLPAHFASMLLDPDVQDPGARDVDVERIMILLRSASSPKASEIIWDTIDSDILAPIVNVLDGPGRDVRASLSFAVLMGIAIMRTVMPGGSLKSADCGELRERLTALFAAALAPDAEEDSAPRLHPRPAI